MDNNPVLHGSDENGISVFSPIDAATKYPNALAVLCLDWNTRDSIREQCMELGLECVTLEECWQQLVASVESC
jgi:hypothetical protein